MTVFNAVITLLLTPYFATRIYCKTVRIFTYSSTREQSNERSGARLKTRARLRSDAKNTLALPWVPEVLLACGGIFGVGRGPTRLRPCGLGFLPLRGAGTGFVGVLPLALAFDLPENTTLHRETTLKTALELLDTEFTKRFEAKCRQ